MLDEEFMSILSAPLSEKYRILNDCHKFLLSENPAYQKEWVLKKMCVVTGVVKDISSSDVEHYIRSFRY